MKNSVLEDLFGLNLILQVTLADFLLTSQTLTLVTRQP